MKHINIHCHFLKRAVSDKSVNFISIPSTQQAVNSLTKPLGKNCLALYQEVSIGMQL